MFLFFYISAQFLSFDPKPFCLAFEKLIFAESDVRMLEYADIYLEDVTVEPLVENSFEYLQMKNPLQNIHAQPNNFLKTNMVFHTWTNKICFNPFCNFLLPQAELAKVHVY